MDKQAEGLLGCIGVPAVLAFVLYAVWPSQSTKDRVHKGIEQDQRVFAAQDRVKAELRDPTSAVFVDVGPAPDGSRTICGRVNSRNGFGGMAGAQRFIVTRDRVFLEEQEEAVVPGTFAGFWQQMCG